MENKNNNMKITTNAQGHTTITTESFCVREDSLEKAVQGYADIVLHKAIGLMKQESQQHLNALKSVMALDFVRGESQSQTLSQLWGENIILEDED